MMVLGDSGRLESFEIHIYWKSLSDQAMVAGSSLFNDHQIEIMRQFSELYIYQKELRLYAEELTNESFLPPINEIANSFDHFMRAFSIMSGMRSPSEIENEEKYVEDNLNQMVGHVRRATLEYIDFIRIYQMEAIIDLLKDYSPKTIAAIFPQYYQIIKPKLLALMDLNLKWDECTEWNLDDIKKYIELVNLTKSYYREILRALPYLSENIIIKDFPIKVADELDNTESIKKQRPYTYWKSSWDTHLKEISITNNKE